MKTGIKLIVTPEQSETVQKICFANDIQPWGLTDKVVRNLDQAFISISKDKILGKYNYALGDNKFYFWDKDENKEVDADLFIRTNGTCGESTDIIDNLSNNKSKEAMFKQYGFEVPDFDCTILAKIKNNYIGYVINNNNVITLSWTLSGNCYIGITYTPKHNLNPIKQPWYETCKYPVIVKTEDSNIFIIKDELQNYTEVTLKTLTPLSNEEIDQLKQDF